jgi:hypothetical protein
MANHPLTVYLRGHYAGGHTAIRRLREQAVSDSTNDRRTFLGALAAEIDADLSTLQDVMIEECRRVDGGRAWSLVPAS